MVLIDYIIENALIIIPVLNIIGMIIKNLEKINNKYIPLILLPFGIIGCCAILGFNAESIIQGVLITGVSVYGNQIIKQFNKE